MRKGLFVILGLCALAVSFVMATPSPTAKYLIERLDNVERLAGAYRPFVAARPITATTIDDSLFGLVPDSMAWADRANAFTAANTFAGATSLNGAVTTLGDTVLDSVRVRGQMFTNNYDGSSKWVPIYVPGALKTPALWFCGVRWYGVPTAGYSSALQVSSIVDTAAASGQFHGIEGKVTSEVTTTGTAATTGVYGKLVVSGTSKTNILGYGVRSLIDIASGDVLTDGANFYAEMSNSGTLTAGSILQSSAGTWTKGIDFDASTISGADITLQNSATITNGSASTLTITEGTIALAGAVTATSVAIGSSGSVLTKVWVTGTGASDSLLFIVGNDTFVATQVRVGH